MHKLRTKKLKNSTQKYLPHVFNDNIVQLLLDKNEKAIQQTTKNYFDKAQDTINRIKHEIEMLSSDSYQKCILKAVCLNTEAYFLQKQNKYDQALDRLTQAEQVEKNYKLGTILMAKTKLNKSVILSYLGRHDESIKLCREALDLLKNNKDTRQLQLGKNRYKLYEIMIISFYNIATELSHLKDIDEASKVFKEGFKLSLRILGPNHKLTMLLRSIVKSNKQKSKSKQKIQHSQSKQKQKIKVRSIILMPVQQREKQLRRIYASKRKSHSVVKQKKKGEIDFYLKSLEKIKLMYSRKTSDYNRTRLHTAAQFGKNSKRSLRYAGLMTQSGQRTMRSNQPNKGRNVALNKSLEANRVCQSEINDVSLVSSNLKGSVVPLEPIIETKPLEKEKLITEIAQKFEEKSKQGQNECQLI